MALGLNSILLGAECFVLDRVEFSRSFTSTVFGQDVSLSAAATPISANVFQNSGYQTTPSVESARGVRGRTFKPREWMPWSLLAAGAIIVMYTGAAAREST
jgi:hypothetical protein